ncbi:translocation/assembly module TamB domain-containing protein [Caulobacter sp. NIBR2454]|uniref:translocation/assembly module TamB domain-containing protein n=1 Tax=Caulobacter sp. NIBR2454 TaxID=3015996 RepID=UPI0022B6364B|nr:translocation/assembly module TamB domain-containing protein [Caulobacter sp. NIBR2454]
MTDAPPTPPSEDAVAEAVEAVKKVGRSPTFWMLLAAIVVVVLTATASLVVRYGVVSTPGRMFIEARANGLKLGRIGRLKVEGIQGDIWKSFTIRKLSIVDDKGPWLEARNVGVDWTYPALFVRRFQADSITADRVTIIRRPTLSPKSGQPSKALPLSFDIDSMAFRLETLPAFSQQRGLYDVSGDLEIERLGGRRGSLQARSQMHQGDFLRLRFDLGAKDTLLVDAQAKEAAGGAIAGSLGLPANEAFLLDAKASGAMRQGRFDVVARSGNVTPLSAQGAWTPEGGRAEGRAILSSSRLLDRVVRMFGPTASFAIAGRKASDGFFDLDGRLKAENLRLSLNGGADLGKRLTDRDGVKVSLDVQDMSRLTATPELGRTRYNGLLKGDAKAWSLNGDVVADGASLLGLTLARVEGPLSLARERGEFTIDGDLAGSGGRGAGLIPTLMGARPKARFEGARLADGRLLMRRVRIDGAGIRVEGEGQRSLLGGLSFKGDADVTNLAAARANASGRVSGKWSASQSSAGKPWVFTVDARGANFAAGFGELDRLLGADPRFTMKGSYAEGRVTLGDSKLAGAAATASAAGVIGPAGALQLKLDWTATGPFRIGSLELAGKAKGDGAVSGRLSQPKAALTADFESIDVPRLKLTNAHVVLTFAQGAANTDGAIAITADSEYGPARARSDFRFAPGGMEFSGLDADAGGVKAQGDMSLRRGRPASADLTLAIGPGALLQEGTINGTALIADSAGGPRAKLDLKADNAVPKGSDVWLRRAEIRADGPLDRLPFSITANGDARPGRWNLNGSGLLSDLPEGYGLAFDGGGRLGRGEVKTTETAQLRFGGPRQTARLRLAVGAGRADIDGVLSDAGAELKAVLTSVSLGTLNEDLAGEVDARLSLQGQGSNLSGDLDANLRGARQRGAPVRVGIDGQVKAGLRGDTLTVQASAANLQGLQSHAELVLPVDASAKPLRLAINRQKPVRGNFGAQGEIKSLWDLLIGGERTLAGKVDINGTLGGTLADPRLVGDAAMTGGAFDDGPTGLKLQNVTLRANLADNAIDVSQASAADGRGGTISGGGRINLRRDAASSFRLDLKQFRLIDNDLATASASGQATVERGADGKVRLAGDLTIDQGEISADTVTPPSVPTIEVVERNKPRADRRDLQARASSPGFALDVNLKAPRRVFVRGRGLDVELSLNAHIGGFSNRPDLTGEARVVRGDYDFAGKRFEFDTRGVVYLASSPERIRLDLSATREDPTLTAVVRILGTAAKPEITLTSTPQLPNDEVLSQVLFGASASQLSPLEAAQLASALAALSGGGGFDVIGGLRNLAGLDRLSFAGDAAGMTVAGGKYITDDVYLELIGGGREGPAAQVEWRVRRALAIVSRLSSQGDNRLSVRWRRDY